jgi:hypothetical protein
MLLAPRAPWPPPCDHGLYGGPQPLVVTATVITAHYTGSEGSCCSCSGMPTQPCPNSLVLQSHVQQTSHVRLGALLAGTHYSDRISIDSCCISDS